LFLLILYIFCQSENNRTSCKAQALNLVENWCKKRKRSPATELEESLCLIMLFQNEGLAAESSAMSLHLNQAALAALAANILVYDGETSIHIAMPKKQCLV